MSNYKYDNVAFDTNVYIDIMFVADLISTEEEIGSTDIKNDIISRLNSLRSSTGASKIVMLDTVKVEFKKYRDNNPLAKLLSNKVKSEMTTIVNQTQPYLQFNSKDSKFIRVPEKDPSTGRFKRGEKDNRRDHTILLTCYQYKIGNFVSSNYEDMCTIYKDLFSLLKGIKIYIPIFNMTSATIYEWISLKESFSKSLAGRILRMIHEIYSKI